MIDFRTAPKDEGWLLRKSNPVIRGLKLLDPLPDPEEKWRGWRLNQLPRENDLINCESIIY